MSWRLWININHIVRTGYNSYFGYLLSSRHDCLCFWIKLGWDFGRNCRFFLQVTWRNCSLCAFVTQLDSPSAREINKLYVRRMPVTQMSKKSINKITEWISSLIRISKNISAAVTKTYVLCALHAHENKINSLDTAISLYRNLRSKWNFRSV